MSSSNLRCQPATYGNELNLSDHKHNSSTILYVVFTYLVSSRDENHTIATIKTFALAGSNCQSDPSFLVTATHICTSTGSNTGYYSTRIINE